MKYRIGQLVCIGPKRAGIILGVRTVGYSHKDEQYRVRFVGGFSKGVVEYWLLSQEIRPHPSCESLKEFLAD